MLIGFPAFGDCPDAAAVVLEGYRDDGSLDLVIYACVACAVGLAADRMSHLTIDADAAASVRPCGSAVDYADRRTAAGNAPVGCEPLGGAAVSPLEVIPQHGFTRMRDGRWWRDGPPRG